MTFLKHCKTGLLAFWLAPKNHGKSGLHHEHVAPHEKTERRGMSNSLPLNPFMSALGRLRGDVEIGAAWAHRHEWVEGQAVAHSAPLPDLDIPAKPPKGTNHSRAPIEGNVHLLLDSNGRQTVSLERRTSGITIESREQWLASEAKKARIAGGVR